MTEKIEDMFIAHQSEMNYVKRLISCKINGQYIKGYHDAACYMFSNKKHYWNHGMNCGLQNNIAKT